MFQKHTFEQNLNSIPICPPKCHPQIFRSQPLINGYSTFALIGMSAKFPQKNISFSEYLAEFLTEEFI
jgi:hypothetical protein